MTEFSAPRLTPAQAISHYSPDEWEEFVSELVDGLSGAQEYHQVKRMGGPGDLGIDVAGFKSDDGLEGPWDCYQCKHYASALTPGDAWAEIVKVFRAVAAGECVIPDAYWLAAPKGAGLRLNKLLSQPSKSREKFIEWLDSRKPDEAFDATARAAVKDLALATDFNRFNAIQPRDIIELHRPTKAHAIRFDLDLPERAPAAETPTHLTSDEHRYVDQLVAAYKQRHSGEDITRDNVAEHPDRGLHFVRQRQAFFRAEELRVYARESTPDGTFDRLQNDVHAGVVEVCESDHHDGYARAQAVLAASSAIDLSNHRLVERADHEDRKGMCHQLVNEARLTWVSEVT